MSTRNEQRIARLVAGHIDIDQRTAAKALRGEPVLPVVRKAVEMALRELNINLEGADQRVGAAPPLDKN